jgi:spermidine/putrescine transport system permease protein
VSSGTAATQRPAVAGAASGVSFPRWLWPSFAAPATAYLLVFFVFPFFVILGVTFGTIDPILQTPIPQWNPARWDTGVLSFTLSNISHSDGIYYGAFFRTLVYVGLATLLCLLVGYPFAYFVARHAGRFKGLFLALFFAPFWVSYMLRLTAWIGLLQDDGWINRLLHGAGLTDAPIGFLDGHVGTLLAGLVYGYVPYMILPLLAALDRIPTAHVEAARDLGASPARTFVRVTLPASRQAILAGVIICGLPMFGDYFTQQLVANVNGTRMIGNFIVDQLRIPIFLARGAALILVLLALLIVPIAYYLWSTTRVSRERLS